MKHLKLLFVTLLFIAASAFVVHMANNPHLHAKQAHAQSTNAAQISHSEANLISLSPDMNQNNPYLFIDPPRKGWDAPNFTVSTANGQTIKLSDFEGKKNVVLVFYQGSFCSVCGRQLANIQKHWADFKTHEATVIAISADDKTHAMKTLGERGLSFYIAPDPDKEIINAFGIANQSKDGIAWPSAFIVDKQGKVQMSYAEESGHRLHASDLLTELSKFTGKPAPTFGYND